MNKVLGKVEIYTKLVCVFIFKNVYICQMNLITNNKFFWWPSFQFEIGE